MFNQYLGFLLKPKIQHFAENLRTKKGIFFNIPFGNLF